MFGGDATVSNLPDLILDAAAVGRLNWQPRACPAPLECTASRRRIDGVDVLELIDGPTFPPRGAETGYRITGPRHRYRLEPHTDTTVRTVCIDTQIWAGHAQ